MLLTSDLWKQCGSLWRDGTIPVLPTPVSFCFELLIYLFILDKRVFQSVNTAAHPLCYSKHWFVGALSFLCLPPSLFKDDISIYLMSTYMIVGSRDI